MALANRAVTQIKLSVKSVICQFCATSSRCAQMSAFPPFRTPIADIQGNRHALRMRIYFFAAIGVAAALLLSIGADAVTPPRADSDAKSLALLHLKRGEAYAHARPKLLRNGWQPIRSNGYRGHIDDILGAGWVEVSNCLGTGLGFCTFDWKRGRQCARVITYGEYLPERSEPKIHAAKLGACTQVIER